MEDFTPVNYRLKKTFITFDLLQNKTANGSNITLPYCCEEAKGTIKDSFNGAKEITFVLDQSHLLDNDRFKDVLKSLWFGIKKNKMSERSVSILLNPPKQVTCLAGQFTIIDHNAKRAKAVTLDKNGKELGNQSADKYTGPKSKKALQREAKRKEKRQAATLKSENNCG